MICLTCGAENSNKSKSCQGCAKAFEFAPPYGRTNHICQFQMAIRDFLDGKLDFDRLGESYGRFAELAMEFQDKWRLLEGLPLADRLSEPMRPTFRAGMAELDRALAILDESLTCADDALESGETDQLATVDELLTDFFKISCGGCATLMDALDILYTSDGFGSFLDVRSL